MLHVSTGGLTPEAVWAQELPTFWAVVVSRIVMLKICVTSVPLGNVIVIVPDPGIAVVARTRRRKPFWRLRPARRGCWTRSPG
jgi:hypothetical protein